MRVEAVFLDDRGEPFVQVTWGVKKGPADHDTDFDPYEFVPPLSVAARKKATQEGRHGILPATQLQEYAHFAIMNPVKRSDLPKLYLNDCFSSFE